MSVLVKQQYPKVQKYLPSSEILYKQARKILKGYGFSDKQIIKEHPIPELNMRIDLVGISEDLKVAIEIGFCGPEKLFALQQVFDDVVWLPYWLIIIPTMEDGNIKERHRKIVSNKNMVIGSLRKNYLQMVYELEEINKSVTEIIYKIRIELRAAEKKDKEIVDIDEAINSV